MKYVTFGKSGLRVSELSLGTMTFGDQYNWGASNDESKKIFDAYITAGGNFIDTANFYSTGGSESLLAGFIKDIRKQLVIATKYTYTMNLKDPNAGGSHRKNMVQSVEESLKRLKTDYIDIFWVHAYDPYTPIDEVLRGLDDLVRQGKVLYIGFSDAPSWIVSASQVMAELRGWTSFTGVQVEYNLIERTVERDLLPMAKHFNLAVTAWSPLASGLLSGKYNSKDTPANEKRLSLAAFKQVSERNLAIADKVIEVAKQIGRSPSQVALNWLRQQHASIIPIVGARKFSQFEDNLKALEFELSPEHLAILSQSSEIELGFPHDHLNATHGLIKGDVELTRVY